MTILEIARTNCLEYKSIAIGKNRKKEEEAELKIEHSRYPVGEKEEIDLKHCINLIGIIKMN